MISDGVKAAFVIEIGTATIRCGALKLYPQQALECGRTDRMRTLKKDYNHTVLPPSYYNPKHGVDEYSTDEYYYYRRDHTVPAHHQYRISWPPAAGDAYRDPRYGGNSNPAAPLVAPYTDHHRKWLELQPFASWGALDTGVAGNDLDHVSVVNRPLRLAHALLSWPSLVDQVIVPNHERTMRPSSSAPSSSAQQAPIIADEDDEPVAWPLGGYHPVAISGLATRYEQKVKADLKETRKERQQAKKAKKSAAKLPNHKFMDADPSDDDNDNNSDDNDDGTPTTAKRAVVPITVPAGSKKKAKTVVAPSTILPVAWDDDNKKMLIAMGLPESAIAPLSSAAATSSSSTSSAIPQRYLCWRNGTASGAHLVDTHPYTTRGSRSCDSRWWPGGMPRNTPADSKPWPKEKAQAAKRAQREQ